MISRIDQISSMALQGVEDKVGGLVGTQVNFTLQSAALTRKNEFLDRVVGENIIVGLDLKGSHEGQGCLIAAQRSAIIAGAKMIMLPRQEMNSQIAAGACEEEVGLAFDEIARTVIDAFLKPFKNPLFAIPEVVCRRRRSIQGREAVRALESLDPEQAYYQVIARVTIGDHDPELWLLLLPAFILVCSSVFKGEAPSADDNPLPFAGAAAWPPAAGAGTLASVMRLSQREAGSPSVAALTHSLGPILEKELQELLGVNVRCVQEGPGLVASEELEGVLQEMDHVCTVVSIRGAVEGEILLIVERADAIRLGSLLSDGKSLEAGVSGAGGDDFHRHRQDGYRDISTLITEALSMACTGAEGALTFEKRDFLHPLDQPPPVNITTPSRQGWLSMVTLGTAEAVSARILLLLPVDLVEALVGKGHQERSSAVTEPDPVTLQEVRGGPDLNLAKTEGVPTRAGRVVVISHSQGEAETICQVAEKEGLGCLWLTQESDLDRALFAACTAVFLVVDALDEMVLGTAIKIQSFCLAPLIVAASRWTQPEVMRALRYGVRDILMTPLEQAEVREKVRGLEVVST